MSDREQFEAARAAGLKARHETRVERAIRRQVAEEIATAIVAGGREATPERLHSLSMAHQELGDARFKAYEDAARIAREIGAKETS